MATDLAAFKAELASAVALEESCIRGYQELVLLPLSNSAKSEIEQAIAWSTNRLRALQYVASHLDTLLATGYPVRDEQLVPAEVVVELNDHLARIASAAAEFHAPVTGAVTVGDPLPV